MSESNTSSSFSTQAHQQIGSRNIQLWGLDIHPVVFSISAAFIIGLTIFTLGFTDIASEYFIALRPWITTQFDWLFIIGVNIIVCFCFILMLSPLGKVVIGGKDAVPEHSYASWFAMLFAAGMGIGIMFYGVLEPVNHFITPPLGVDPANSAEVKDLAMSATILHWGFHPWAVYALVGMALAMFCYNKGLPLTIRSAFEPILGDKIWGWAGDVIDILAIIATVFGMAASLGYGATQAAGGLDYVFGISSGIGTQVAVIVCIAAVAIFSVYQGIDAGIKRLSQLNIFTAICLCLFAIIVGSSFTILGNFFNNTANYIMDLPKLSNWIGREDNYYYHDWTTFYWSWWIAWSPFVGMFIARISKGRTIRQFLLCTLFVPTLFSSLWMTTFGDSAIDSYVQQGYLGVVEVISKWQPELAMFKHLDQLPFKGITSFIAICLVMIFFITSLDSGALVIDTMAAGGKLNVPVKQRILWCLLVAIVTMALLVGGGEGQKELAALQALSLATALPFTVLILIMCFTIVHGLRSESKK